MQWIAVTIAQIASCCDVFYTLWGAPMSCLSIVSSSSSGG